MVFFFSIPFFRYFHYTSFGFNFGGLMPEQDDQQVSTIVYVIPDQNGVDWTQFRNRHGVNLALQDFPKPLRLLQRVLVNALRQRQIKLFQFDSLSADRFFANGKPFDFDLLEIKPVDDLLELTQWWINRQHLLTLCSLRCKNGKQPNSNWMCECGYKVAWNQIICANPNCPSWAKIFLCTGKTIRATSQPT